jgi:hypothetical protein
MQQKQLNLHNIKEEPLMTSCMQQTVTYCCRLNGSELRFALSLCRRITALIFFSIKITSLSRLQVSDKKYVLLHGIQLPPDGKINCSKSRTSKRQIKFGC